MVKKDTIYRMIMDLIFEIKKKGCKRQILSFLYLSALPLSLFSQGPPPDPSCPIPPCVPIDDHIVFLIAAGLILVLVKTYKQNVKPDF